MNFQDRFTVSILTILCDGKSLTFFNFLDRRQTRKASPYLFISKFPSGKLRQDIVGLDPGSEFFNFSRSVCESLFYLFLNGYYYELQAYWTCSVEATKKGHGRQLIPKWQNTCTWPAMQPVEPNLLAPNGKRVILKNLRNRLPSWLGSRFLYYKLRLAFLHVSGVMRASPNSLALLCSTSCI